MRLFVALYKVTKGDEQQTIIRHSSGASVTTQTISEPVIMIIAVLGATGGTGIRLVKEALAAQHNVIAIVRNPDKLDEIKDDRLEVNTSIFIHFCI